METLTSIKVFYQQGNNRIYQVKCEIVSSLIINFLNRSVYGIVISKQEDQLTFIFDQIENLDFI